jgi:hypothetical protein
MFSTHPSISRNLRRTDYWKNSDSKNLVPKLKCLAIHESWRPGVSTQMIDRTYNAVIGLQIFHVQQHIPQILFGLICTMHRYSTVQHTNNYSLSVP